MPRRRARCRRAGRPFPPRGRRARVRCSFSGRRSRDFIIDDEFKAEFFFKHALKVPLLESVDWEVVIKTHERGVKEGISFPYALMMLTLHDTNSRAGNEHQNIAVAVNRQLIDKLLGVLTDVRAALESSSKICMEIGETNNEKEVKDD